MYSDASNFVTGVDNAFVFITGVCLFFLVGITTAMIYFSFRYSRKRHPKAEDVKDNHKIEALWIGIPTVLVLIMFWFGWIGFRPMTEFPNDGLKIKATGKMWSWVFEYENGKWDSILYIPQGKNIILELGSPDVVHSLYIPAFRVKMDVVPGIPNKMWFNANKPGEYDVYCAEYCGTLHSYMLTKVRVLPEAEYLAWYSAEKAVDVNAPPGLDVIKKHACASCHSSDGTKLVGPSFKGFYGSNRKVLTGGSEREVMADDEFTIKSIVDPNADVAVGFQPIMTPYKDRISDEEMKQIIEYMKAVK